MRITTPFFAIGFCISSTLFAQTNPVVMRGSDTLGDKMVPELIKVYRAGSPTQFDVVAEGSSAAFKALLSGEAEIGMSSRPVKDSEKKAIEDKGMKLVEHVAGVDMIAVIVNEANAAKDISVKDVGLVFTGAVSSWKTAAGAQIKPYSRNESSGTFKVFQKLAMNGKDYAKNVQKMEGNGDIVKSVAADAGGIGYVGLSYAGSTGIKALTVGGVAPKPENAEKYPLSRKLYYYTIEGKVSEEGKKFLAWATTDKKAGEVVTKVGFIPAK